MEKEGQTLPVRRDGAFCYSIRLEEDFEKLSECVSELSVKGRRVCIVTDSHVGPLYADEVRRRLSEAFRTVTVYTIEAGEKYKTLDTVRGLYEHLILEHFDRKDMLAALGGGVIGDLTGFAAATYLRGIGFIQIPTTLLSQVDSSIGGKTGVDFDSYKNMVGAFHMPRLVYMNLSVLKTLPERQFTSGMAEILKHGLIKNAEYFQWLIDHRQEILERRMNALMPMILESCRIKRDVMEKDPTEQGERALLNFGHTLAHTIEQYYHYERESHGEAVGIGMYQITKMAEDKGLTAKGCAEKIKKALDIYGLPSSCGLSVSELTEAIRLDKKNLNGNLNLILLHDIGDSYICASDVTFFEGQNSI